MKERLFIIDTTGPFFINHPKSVINWSKVPFEHVEEGGNLTQKSCGIIRTNFEKYITKVSSIGFNAVSIDELSRLVVFDFYPTELKNRIDQYRRLYRQLFSVVKGCGMKIFVTTDIMFSNSHIERHISSGRKGALDLLEQSLERLFIDFPETDGVIFRIGESDGIDVKGDFQSKIVLRTPRQANRCLKRLLPLFERFDKKLIFRTWSIGAYKVGDLIWNGKTFKKVFGDIQSDSLVISMKYGEGDFFRYLELNDNFFLTDHKKILELQARREYEGFGTFPSFTGWDYELFHKKLADVESVVGIQVWCQTGGWSGFRNFTFLKKSSCWNELNTVTALRIFKDSMTAEEAVGSFFGKKTSKTLIEFLRLSDEVVKDLLYDPGFSSRKLYFNRVRIPPLVHISWDTVTVTNHIITLYNVLVKNPQSSLAAARLSLRKLRSMKNLAVKSGIPYDYEYHYRTFQLFALCRELIYDSHKPQLLEKTEKKIEDYTKRFPNTYNFQINTLGRKNSTLVRGIINVLIRENRDYRFADTLLFNGFTMFIYRYLFRMLSNRLPKFVNKQGMPIETLFS